MKVIRKLVAVAVAIAKALCTVDKLAELIASIVGRLDSPKRRAQRLRMGASRLYLRAKLPGNAHQRDEMLATAREMISEAARLEALTR